MSTVTVIEQPVQVTIEAGPTVQVTETPVTVEVTVDGSVAVTESPTTVTVTGGDSVTVQESPVTVEIDAVGHPRTHPIGGDSHELSGLTAGDVLTALTPTSAEFQALPPSVVDHGLLGGLGDDDHPQYPLAAGAETISGAWIFSGIITSNPAVAGIVYQVKVGAQSQAQLQLATDLGLGFGPGTVAPIMSFRRATGLVSGIGANAGWEFYRSTNVTPKLYGVKSTDTQPLWIWGDSSTAGILCQEGPGGAVAPDTKWGRIAAGILGVTNALKIQGIAGTGFLELSSQSAIPASGANVRLYSAANALVSYILATGERVGPLGLLSATVFNGRPTGFGGFSVSGADNNIDGYGLMAKPFKELSGGTESISTSTPEGYPQYQQTTPATINSDVGYQWPLNVEIGNGVPSLVYAVELPQITDIRAFVGFTDQTLATMNGSDNPAGNYVGMQFSSARGDTNWQFVYKDGTTQTVVDSGTPPGTDPKAIRIRVLNSAPEIEWTILSYTGQASVAPATVTTGLPAGTTQVRVVAGLRNLVASTKSIKHSHGFEQWYAV